MTPTRIDSFVPLTTALPASSGERTDFQATVLTQPSEIQKFQSAAIPATATPPTANAAKCQPQVNVQREGNRVTGIRVQCSCGEVIELACTYDVATPAPQAPSLSQPATIPQPVAVDPEPGKICKDSGKEMPKSVVKGPKVPENSTGTSAAKRSA